MADQIQTDAEKIAAAAAADAKAIEAKATADVVVVKGFWAKQVAWVKAHPFYSAAIVIVCIVIAFAL